jgi:transporter family-2 protein
MQPKLLYLLMAFSLGAILPIQAAINARLSRGVGGPVTAAFVSFAVGTIALLGYLFLGRSPLPGPGSINQGPWWIWIGGLLGTFFVAGIVVLVPRIGVALSFGLVIAGQVAVAVILDHYGWLGVPVREISIGKIAGALLLIIGVVLIRKS